MTRGRPPRPTALKLVAGERKKSRLNDDEPQPEDGLPQCPVTDKLVREVWDFTVEQLRKMKVITVADRDMLLAYCQAVVLHRRMSQHLDNTGYLYETEGGLAPSPALRQQKEAALLMKQLGCEFGLTPAARTRIKVADQKVPEEQKTPGRLLSS